MKPVPSVTAMAGYGLKDDANAGRSKRQVLIIERELLDEFQLPTRRCAREHHRAGDSTRRDGAPARGCAWARPLLEATLDCAPCQFIEDKRPGLRAAMEGKRGTLFKVIEGGEIQVGDAIRIV